MLASILEEPKKMSQKKLSIDDVKKIKKLLKERVHTQNDIAIMFGVSISTLQQIRTGKTHKNVVVDE